MRRFIIFYCDTLFPYRWIILLMFMIILWVLLFLLNTFDPNGGAVPFATFIPIYIILLDVIGGIGSVSPIELYIKKRNFEREYPNVWDYKLSNKLTPEEAKDEINTETLCTEETIREAVKILLAEGLVTNGAHHKQWYLEEIARTLKINHGVCENEYDKGIAP